MFRRVLISFLFILSAILPGAAQSLSCHIPVILAEADGVPFTISDEYVDSVLAVCTKYFRDQIGPKDSVVFERGPKVQITGSYDNNTVAHAVVEALRLADPQIKYDEYDKDGIGTLKCVAVIFSGSRIWPRQYYLKQENIYLAFDGKSLDGYIAFSEFFEDAPWGTGLLAHECGHTIGLSDLYDTDGEGSGGIAEALWGSTALMDSGNRNDEARTPAGFNALDFHLLGIGDCDTLKTGSWTLEPISKSHRYLYFPADISGEYYLFECRDQQGWDKAIGGEGMLVYHIDKSRNRAGFSTYYNITLTAYERWERKQINCRPDHQCADLVEACVEADTVSKVFFPYVENQAFTSETEPAFRFWSGKPSRIAIKDITRNADGSVSFLAIEPIIAGSEYIFQDAAILCWTLDESLAADADSCCISLSSAGETGYHQRLEINENGKTSVSLEHLDPNTIYTAEMKVFTPASTYSSIRSFRTKVADKRNTIPFIFLSDAQRGNNGYFKLGTSFPLHVFNASEAEEIRWTFNGRPPKLDDEGLFIVKESGTLRAEVFYSDGSCDIITKEVMVR